MNRRKFIKKSLEGIVIAGIIPLISGCKKNPVESEPESILNINSIIKDNIKYYVQTDKKIYSLGENVEMMYKVTNLSDENVKFIFSTQPVFNFFILKDENVIWGANKYGIYVFTEFTLSPNNSNEFNYVWDMKDDEGNLVNAGKYNAIGELHIAATQVSVPIEIIQ